MSKNRPNKRQRKALARLRRAADRERTLRAEVDACIPRVRVNTTSWNKVSAFRGVGYVSGADPAKIGVKPSRRELHLNSGMSAYLEKRGLTSKNT